ncbi:MAG: zf-HC2 domain-containing protein [Acidimicrobiales bacterium]
MMRLLNRLRGRPTCREIMEVLQSYLDGEIDAETAKRVARHLEDCAACDRESQVYEAIKDTLAARRRPVDPEVLAALRQFGETLEAAD